MTLSFSSVWLLLCLHFDALLCLFYFRTFAASALERRELESQESHFTTRDPLSTASVSSFFCGIFVGTAVEKCRPALMDDLPVFAVPNFMIQGGDFTMGNGRGGESIYGKTSMEKGRIIFQFPASDLSTALFETS